MKFTVDISDEKELRAEIRKLIEGEFKAIARQEAEQILKDELSRILKKFIDDQINGWYGLKRKAEHELDFQIKEHVKFELKGHPLIKDSNHVKLTFEKELPKILKDMNFDTMVKNAIENAKNDAIKKILGDK